MKKVILGVLFSLIFVSSSVFATGPYNTEEYINEQNQYKSFLVTLNVMSAQVMNLRNQNRISAEQEQDFLVIILNLTNNIISRITLGGPVVSPLENNSSRVNQAEPKKNIAQNIYKTYSNQSLGFSTLINNRGIIGEKIGINPIYYERENIKFVYTYDSNLSDNINTQITVWQEEFGECIPDYKRTSPQEEIQKNQNNLTVKKRFWNDVATGHYENLSIYTISNGKRQYCVIGHIGGTRPYDKEGVQYEKQEKINTESIEDFNNVLKVFVENFNFI